MTTGRRVRKIVLLGACLAVLAAGAWLLILDQHRPAAAVHAGESAAGDRAAPGEAPAARAAMQPGEGTERDAVSAGAVVAACADPPAAYLEALGGLTGRLVEPDGAPVPDMPVALIGACFDEILQDLTSVADSRAVEAPPVKATAVTGEEGRFLFTKVDPRGYYALGIDSGGPRAALRIVDSLPNCGELRDLGDIVLEPYVTLVGRVVDAFGEPVEGARIRATDAPAMLFQFGAHNLRPGGGVLSEEFLTATGRHLVAPFSPTVSRLVELLPLPTTYSDQDGDFALGGAPAGIVSVLVDLQDHVTLVHGPVPTGSAGGRRSLGTLLLDRGRELSGRVETSAGEPVPGARVMVGPRLEFDEFAVIWPGGVSDAAGGFRVRGLAEADHYVAVQTPRSHDWTVVSGVVPGADEAVIRLAPAHDLLVTAVGTDGRVIPHPGVLVSVFPEPGVFLPVLSAPSPPRGGISREEDGSVSISGLGSQTYQLLVTKSGYAAATVDVDLAGGPARVQVVMQPARPLSVRVSAAEDAAPVVHASVRAFAAQGGLLRFVPRSSARTDAAGRATLEGLDGGEVLVQVEHPGFALRQQTIAPSAAPYEVPVVLVRGASITGRVVAGALPVDEPRCVGLKPEGDLALPRFAVTDREGCFRFAQLACGAYEVAVLRRFAHDQGIAGLITGSLARLEVEREVSLTLAEGEERELEIDVRGAAGGHPAARLRGRVVLNGRPMARAAVVCRPQGPERGRKSTLTSETGAFDLGQVPLLQEGRVTLCVAPKETSGWEGDIYTQALVMRPGEDREVLVDLETGGLSGRVVRARDQRAAAFARVEIESLPGPPGSSGETVETSIACRADENGRFQADVLPAGDYRVTARLEGCAARQAGPVRVPFQGQPAPLTIELLDALEVSGRVELNGVGPQEFVAMTFSGRGLKVKLAVKRDRTFRAFDLLPGDYTVDIAVYGRSAPRRYRTQVVVPEHGCRDLILRPHPSGG
ncbi:MAG: carboxypeptidase regulatory-like domain-containing protein [Planctomycetes bacterium]|nr:carboxypeptidase regulatory-like domain-containing protein [Planctomycetota bacterium]